MEDIKKIQEFFSNPVKENSRRSPDFILTEPAEIKYTESFGSGIKAPGVLHHANRGAFLGAEDAYIIVLPGGTFYVDEGKEEAIRIYPIKDQSREFQLALDYTPIAPKYETWKSWVKKTKTLEETDVNEELSLEQKKVERFLKAIAKEFDYSIQDAANFVKSTISQMGLKESVNEAYIVTYAKNKGEKPSSAAYKLKDSALAFMRDLEKDGYTVMLTQRPVDGVDEATKDEETEFHKKLDTLVHDTFGKRKGEMEEYNTGIYYKGEETKDKAKEASKSALGKVKDFIKKVIKEEEITVDDATEFKLNLKHLLDKHVVKEEEGYSQFLKTDDNPEGKTKGLDTATMNKILMNVIKDLDELKQLGEGVIEEELCAKGKAYIKKRQAAGEKSSAYLSGRAVKVCKGQMKG